MGPGALPLTVLKRDRIRLKSLGLPAVLPPPEEEKDVKTAIGAARAKAGRKKMLRGQKKAS